MAIMVPVFLLFLACMCCVVCVLLSRRERRQKRERRVSGESREIKILGRWSLGLQLTNRNEGLSTEKMPEIAVGF